MNSFSVCEAASKTEYKSAAATTLLTSLNWINRLKKKNAKQTALRADRLPNC